MNLANLLKYTFSNLTLVFILSSSHCAMAMDNDKIHGLILKATLPNKQEMTFVPTHHYTSLEQFSQSYQQEIFKHSALILESVTIHDASTEEDSLKTGPINQLVNYASEDFLTQLGGFRNSEEPGWSFNDLKNCDTPSMIQNKIESTFREIADFLESNIMLSFPHFKNIYQMKPGVVFALYWEFQSFWQGNDKKGMDAEISDHFLSKSKMVTGVESPEDVIRSLPLSTATIDDIQDDFISPNIGKYLPDLEALHKDFMKTSQEKRLMNQNSLAIRNKSWMNKYENMIDSYGDCVAVHGEDHFPGSEGILQLGQEKGWQWSIFQENGTYQPFKYYPESSNPFVFE